MPPTRQTNPPAPTRESVWFVVVWYSPINGTAITYDNIGNPNKTLNAAGQWVNLQWSGRQLVKATMPNGTYETYTYDADGLRTSRKQYNASNTLTKTCTYFWNEGRLVTQRILLPSGFYEDDWYFYDESGSPYGFNFTNSNNESGIRYLARNLQGDIVEAYGNTGAFGASHKYDAWGTITETVLGSSTNAANFQYGYIFGYRGYQYDKETGLYYCQSRYYNPRVGRFLSADDTWIPQIQLGELLSANLYAYCANNPINDKDSTGMLADKIITGIFGGILSAIVEVLSQSISYGLNNKFSLRGFKFNFKKIAWEFAWGFAMGMFVPTKLSRGAMTLITGLLGGFKGLIEGIAARKKADVLLYNFLIDFTVGAIIGFIGGPGLKQSMPGWRASYGSFVNFKASGIIITAKTAIPINSSTIRLLAKNIIAGIWGDLGSRIIDKARGK